MRLVARAIVDALPDHDVAREVHLGGRRRTPRHLLPQPGPTLGIRGQPRARPFIVVFTTDDLVGVALVAHPDVDRVRVVPEGLHNLNHLAGLPVVSQSNLRLLSPSSRSGMKKRASPLSRTRIRRSLCRTFASAERATWHVRASPRVGPMRAVTDSPRPGAFSLAPCAPTSVVAMHRRDTSRVRCVALLAIPLLAQGCVSTADAQEKTPAAPTSPIHCGGPEDRTCPADMVCLDDTRDDCVNPSQPARTPANLERFRLAPLCPGVCGHPTGRRCDGRSKRSCGANEICVIVPDGPHGPPEADGVCVAVPIAMPAPSGARLGEPCKDQHSCGAGLTCIVDPRIECATAGCRARCGRDTGRLCGGPKAVRCRSDEHCVLELPRNPRRATPFSGTCIALP